jgi:murein DD-endopeptidase MepM/ murein hydrolase activator NlpD
MKQTWHKASIFNTQNFSRIFGLQLAGLATALSVVAYPTHAFDYSLAASAQPEPSAQVVMTTQTQYQFPLEETLGMSQGYGGLHPGVDLRAPKGTAVYSMAEGTIVEVESMFVGYGHFVRIAHNGTISSLYAHLDQVQVKPGQKVKKGETIGTVGLTGWSTGYHLHFEVHSGEKSVNPLGYIGAVKQSR